MQEGGEHVCDELVDVRLLYNANSRFKYSVWKGVEHRGAEIHLTGNAQINKGSTVVPNIDAVLRISKQDDVHGHLTSGECMGQH